MKIYILIFKVLIFLLHSTLGKSLPIWDYNSFFKKKSLLHNPICGYNMQHLAVCCILHAAYWVLVAAAVGAWSCSHWTTRELRFIFRWQNVSIIAESLAFEKPKTSLSILVFKYWDEYSWTCRRPCSQRIAPEPAATQSSVSPFIFSLVLKVGDRVGLRVKILCEKNYTVSKVIFKIKKTQSTRFLWPLLFSLASGNWV